MIKRTQKYYEDGDRRRYYVVVPAAWHRFARAGASVPLHRLLCEFRMGRYLTEDECVHHIDKNTENNHWDNLVVMTKSDHSRLHALEKVDINPKNNKIKRVNKIKKSLSDRLNQDYKPFQDLVDKRSGRGRPKKTLYNKEDRK